jgi:hypothetical protein
VIRVSPEQLARAEVIPHPATNPTARALGGGRPAPNPLAIASRATIAATGERLPPAPGARQAYQPPVAARNAPAGGGMASGPPRTPPRLITRSPQPPPNVPFSVRQQALQAHPGRPLEPQQEENLRAGKPAGPMRDREFPPHPAPTARAEGQQPTQKSASTMAPQSGSGHRH